MNSLGHRNRNHPSRKRSRKPRRDYLVSDAQVNADGVHVWPFESKFPIDVIHHFLSGRQPFRMNRHNYFELVYVTSGKLVWQVQDREVSEQKGDLFVIGSQKYHRVTEHSSSQAAVESLFFHPDLIRAGLAPGDDSEYLMPFLMQDSSFQHVVPGNTGIPGEIRRLIGLVKEELPANSDRARLCVKTYLKMILVLLLKHYASYRKTSLTFDRQQRALDRFKPLFDFLERNYSDPISPSDAAKAVNMSPSHFRRAFKNVTGQSFVLYLNHFRIAKAEELLTVTDKPIAEVGLEVGFCDQSYFGLIFRKLTRVTPRQYRQNLSSNEKKDHSSSPKSADPTSPGVGHLL